MWSIKRKPIVHDFETLRIALKGMLPAKIYQEYYFAARDASKGSILELGTGQGASTVAFALGIKDSGRSGRVIAVDQFSQHSPSGPHPASRKSDGEKTVAINLAAFEAGLRKYDVQDIVETHVGTTEAVAESVSARIHPDSQTPDLIDVLAIDVDGMLDRDLNLFYDCLPLGGLLIFDDYADTINRRGLIALERFRNWDQETASQKISELSSFQRRRLLGKHLLTYRLVERFAVLNMLSKEKVIGSTAFCRKTSDVSIQDRWTRDEGCAVERSVIDDFLKCLRNTDALGKRSISSLIKGVRRAKR